MELHSQHEVSITALANSGDGVGRIQERVVFVPYSCPGDKLLVQITKVQKNFLKAKIEKIIEPSLDRKEPPCPHFAQCGGCDWQHIEYATQLQWKEKNLKEVLSKIAGLQNPPIQPIKKSPKEFHYRNRIQMEYDSNHFYLHRKSSHQLVAIESCLLAEEKINQSMKDILQQVKQKKRKGRLEIASFSDRVDYFAADKNSKSDLGFRQVNTLQNLELKKKVIDIVRENKVDKVVDLYCGQGNWAFALSEELPHLEILGIDSNPINIEKAREKAKNCVNPPSFLLGKAEKLYSSQEGSLIILDPPRAGCSPRLLETLKTESPQWLIYISCHPATMARDLKSLKTKYELVEIQPMDMFPQTAHLECLTLLRSASQVNTDH